MDLRLSKIHPKAKYYLQNIVTTTIAWLFAVLLYTILRTVGIEEAGEALKVKHDDFEIDFLATVTGGLVLGISFGILDILLDRDIIRKKSYGFIILLKSFLHILVLTLAVYLIVVVLSLFDTGIAFRARYSFSILKLVSSEDFYVFLIYTWIVSMVITLIKQVNLKFGPGNLVRFMLGTYLHPREEERIFMFLDMRSSTTYAEKLGHIRYSKLIQDCFYYLTDVVIERRVEIYHYVGDEAILTWRVEDGLEDANCIRAYFDFARILEGKEAYFFEHYSICPEFKAGVNIGLATVAEVGEIKRELHFHGDVLNTAARIQGECNKYNKRLLISEDLKRRLSPKLDLNIELIGSISLKGKETNVNVYSVEEKEDLIVEA